MGFGGFTFKVCAQKGQNVNRGRIRARLRMGALPSRPGRNSAVSYSGSRGTSVYCYSFERNGNSIGTH